VDGRDSYDSHDSHGHSTGYDSYDSHNGTTANSRHGPDSPGRLDCSTASECRDNHDNAEDADFAYFWAMYPVQSNRSAARRVYVRKLQDRVNPIAILEGLRRYIAHREAMGSPHYWKQPANWLRDEGWKHDYPAPESRAKDGVDRMTEWLLAQTKH
jgi:hypothetical protein